MEWTITELSNIDPFIHIQQAYRKIDADEEISRSLNPIMWDIDKCEVVKWLDQNLMWQGAEWCVSVKWSTFILSSYHPPLANGQCA